MAKIGHSFAYTFQPGQNQWAKINLEIHDIDTDLPIDEQMRGVDDAVEIIWEYLRNRVDRQIEEIHNEAKGKNAS